MHATCSSLRKGSSSWSREFDQRAANEEAEADDHGEAESGEDEESEDESGGVPLHGFMA